MKQMIFNFAVSSMCSPVLLLIRKFVSNSEAYLAIGGLWVGFSLACLINGIICLCKD